MSVLRGNDIATSQDYNERDYVNSWMLTQMGASFVKGIIQMSHIFSEHSRKKERGGGGTKNKDTQTRLMFSRYNIYHGFCSACLHANICKLTVNS